MQTRDIRLTRPKVKNSAAKVVASTPKTEQPEPPKSSDSITLEGVKTSSTVSSAELKEAAADSALSASLSANLPPTIGAATATAFKSGFVKGYLSPTEIRQRCESLQKEFPHLIEIIDTGIDSHGYNGSNQSLQGSSDLFYLRIGPQTDDRDKQVGVFQFKAPHARERVPAMAMTEFTEQLVRNYDPESNDPKVRENTKLMNDLDIYVAINTNPDGSNFVIHDDEMWRKNRAPIENSEHVGVDINRNYPYQWEKSNRPSGQTFSGKGPGSEPETQALLKVMEEHKNVMFVTDWHSYGEEIRQPMGASAADQEFYADMHGRVRKEIKSVAGHDYEPVVSQVTKGSSDDHFYHVENAYSTVMETGREFIPSEEEALVVKDESVAGAYEFLRVASDYQDELNA